MLSKLDLTFFVILFIILLWGLGSYKALKMYRNLIVIEKDFKKYGIDKFVYSKPIGYVLCFMFSWLSYSALKRL